MKINGREPPRRVTIGPYLEPTLLRAAVTSDCDFRSHFMLLMIGSTRGPGGNFDMGVNMEIRAFSRVARHAVMMITNHVSISLSYSVSF